MTPLATAALALALLFAALTALNLVLFRAPRPAPAGARPRVSLLIPARNEAATIGAALDAALASEGVDLEVVVLDDGSTDATAAEVAARAARDKRLRLISGPDLPPGWNGKQHACWTLAQAAQGDLLAFQDADVRLAPDALARVASFMEARRLDLASGFPQEETRTLGEALIVPMIHVLLLGYLPLALARLRRRAPSFAAGCGQFMVARRGAYFGAGGHAAIRASRHDGVTLPRAFRRAGAATDILDATPLARCRMYAGFHESWAGFSKNATEGMATPRGLPVWTVLLGGGHVLPFLLAPLALWTGETEAAATAAVAALLVWSARALIAWRFRQDALGALLHPLAVALVLALQWTALIRSATGRPTVWRGRAYST